MCRVLPDPCWWTIPMAAEPSVQTAQSTPMPKSFSTTAKPWDWATPFTSTYRSASPLDQAIACCEVDRVLSVWHPQVIAPPLVNLRLSRSPEQSLSVQSPRPLKQWQLIAAAIHLKPYQKVPQGVPAEHPGLLALSARGFSATSTGADFTFFLTSRQSFCNAHGPDPVNL